MSGILFIVNPLSGNGRKRYMVEKLRSRGFNVVCTEYAGHAEKLAAEAEESTVVAVGGDGTVNEVARGLYSRMIASSGSSGEESPTLGIIPCGSGDGLARTLGISRNFEEALRTVIAGNTHNLDCGTIAGRMFFSVCGTGLDAIVAQRFAQAGDRGLHTYIKEALGAWRNFVPEDYKVTIDDRQYDFKSVFITVANSRQWGNGAVIAPGADCGDGLLDISVVDMFRSIEIPLLVCRLMTGRIAGSRHFTGLKGRNIVIERTSAGPAHFDGDFFEGGKKLEIHLLDKQLKVIHG